MVSKACSDFIEQSSEDRRKKAQEIDERKKNGEQEPRTKIVKDLNLSPDKPLYFSFLHSLLLPVSVHEEYEEVTAFGKTFTVKKKYICNKFYSKFDPAYENCNRCEEEIRVDGKVRKNKPKNMVRGLIYVHSYVDQKFEGHPIEPTRIMNLRFGKEDINLKKLKESARKGHLFKGLFKIEMIGTGKAAVYPPLEFTPKEAVQTVLGDELLSTSVPENIAEFYSSKSEDDAAHILLAGLHNVNLKAFELLPATPEQLIMFPPDETKDGTSSVRKALG